MTVLLFTHPACVAHDTSPGHPERSARLEAVLAALGTPEFASLDRREAREATVAEIARVHPEPYVQSVLAAMPAEGYAAFDNDTVVSPGSRAAVLRAAGAACAAVDAVMAAEGMRAFCAVRPPGHHAEPARAMGFCIFNNVAIGARHARAAHGAARVAVVDFDVHHGNGTQAAFENEPDLFYASTHQWPLYPGTGRRSETGVGNIINVPLPPGTTGPDFRVAFAEAVLPALETFRPDLVMISAGFDAHTADPLAELHLETPDFAWVTEKLVGVADRHCRGRIVSLLEGGYDLRALADGAAAHVRALMAG